MSIVSVLSLRVRAGEEEAIARLYDDLEIFELSRQSGGFLGGRLLRPLLAGEPFLVIAEWERPEDYQGWLDNPVRAELGEKIMPLLDGEVVAGTLYTEAG